MTDDQDQLRSIAAESARLERELALVNERNEALEGLAYLSSRVVGGTMTLAIEAIAHRLAMLEARLESSDARNDSLAAINRDVETQNDKLSAMLVELYNYACGDHGGDIDGLAPPDGFDDRMRECGIEVEQLAANTAIAALKP